mmetsp:Transcript_30879/g.71153  ORF Transcript_30879/g.71153 Transcript_30879/m.71153 type:complete len:142 (-) Transcript_30879:189-614(-)
MTAQMLADPGAFLDGDSQPDNVVVYSWLSKVFSEEKTLNDDGCTTTSFGGHVGSWVPMERQTVFFFLETLCAKWTRKKSPQCCGTRIQKRRVRVLTTRENGTCQAGEGRANRSRVSFGTGYVTLRTSRGGGGGIPKKQMCE